MRPGTRLDRCDVHGGVVAREDLVYKRVTWLRHAGENRLPWWNYSAAHWGSMGTGAFDSYDSLGVVADGRRMTWDEASPPHGAMVDGCATFSGILLFYPLDTIDATGQTDITFAVEIGPWEESVSPALSVDVGFFTPPTEDVVYVPHRARTYALLGAKRVWFHWDLTTLPADLDITALTPYFEVTPVGSSKWWWEQARVEFGRQRPSDNPIATAGAAVVYTKDTRITGEVKACSKCRAERIPDDEEVTPLHADDFGEDRYSDVAIDIPEET